MTGHIGTETRPKLLREAAVGNIGQWGQPFSGEFDPGSGRTLAACLTHASRTEFIRKESSDDGSINLVADG